MGRTTDCLGRAGIDSDPSPRAFQDDAGIARLGVSERLLFFAPVRGGWKETRRDFQLLKPVRRQCRFFDRFSPKLQIQTTRSFPVVALDLAVSTFFDESKDTDKKCGTPSVHDLENGPSKRRR